MRARGVLFVVLLGASLVTTAERSEAGRNRWTTNGPFGGSTTAIATHPTDPSVVLAGNAGGIFRSANAGSSWTFSSEGLPADAGILDLEFAPSNPAVVFAATYTAGLRKSSDGGRRWTLVSPGLVEGTFETVAVDPTNSQIVYASSGSETYKSVDGGASWRELYRGPESSLSATELVIAPSAPNTIYAAGPGWLRSTDGGATWVEVFDAPPHWQTAVVDPTNPNVVVAGTGHGIYRTTDGGSTWSLRYDLPDLDEMRAVAIDPTDPSRMYAGAYFSGAFRSFDGGRTWSPYNGGLPPYLSSFHPMLAMSVLADGSAVVAGNAYFGFFKRAAEADAWRPANEGLVGSNVRALATPPSGGPRVYAGVLRQGVARSDDNGASWRWMGLTGRVIDSIAVHPTRADIVYAATDGGLYKSTNAGTSWRLLHRVRYEGHTAVAIAPSRPRVVYAATFEGGVFRSDDSGDTWRKLSLDPYSVVFSLAVHPEKPYTVYAGTYYLSVARSTDGGKTWHGRDDFLYGYARHQIAIDPARPRIVYVAIETGGIFRSTDSGRTWRQMVGGTPPLRASAVVVDRSHPNVIYAGAFGDEAPGVFKSTDRGQTWTRINQDLTTTNVDSLAVTRSGRVLHAGTTGYWDGGGGVFSRTFG